MNTQGEILLSDERRGKVEFTKFPGGGVLPGEGIRDALHREISEELAEEILDATFFYFNDFFQQSTFRKEQQVISFYYLVKLSPNFIPPLNAKFPEGALHKDDFEKFRWINRALLKEEQLTFPLDRIVFNKLKMVVPIL